MGKSKSALARNKRESFGTHGGNRDGVRTDRVATPKRNMQARGKDPPRGRKER